MHKLLENSPGKQLILLGNEAITRGAIEAGVGYGATYPGTPSSEISQNLFQISKESDLYFEYSTNEKVSMEGAAAAAASEIRSICIMKHVGVNVAADTLMTLAYVGVKGGMVIISADDPSMFSSQNEQDNRYYGKLASIPILEPSTIDEARAMTKDAFTLSEQLHEPVMLRTTTRINHSTGIVTLGEIIPCKVKGHFQKDPTQLVTLPSCSRKLHVKLLNNLSQAQELSETSPWNTISGKGNWGIVCNGVSYNYVVDGINELGIQDRVKILRLGFSYPLPSKKIHQFLQSVDRVLVVEEGEPFIEEAVKVIAQENQLTISIQGKAPSLFSRLYEYDPGMVKGAIASFFGLKPIPDRSLDLSNIPEIPQRPPNLCAGCSHRATYYAVKKAAHGMNAIYPTDIGCYTLGMLPPLNMADYLLCMGSSIGSSCGFSKVNDTKVVAFIGDSTFFHTGLPGLVNAVFNQHNFTVVILDNGTTAMTGHQPHPGVDMESWGYEGYQRISIESVVRAIGVQHVAIIKPYQINKSIETIKQALLFQGVSVIISQEPCTLLKKNQKKTKRVFHISEKCKNHRNCLNELACPAFYLDQDRVKINPALCTGCSVCAQICPENAIIPKK